MDLGALSRVLFETGTITNLRDQKEGGVRIISILMVLTALMFGACSGSGSNSQSLAAQEKAADFTLQSLDNGEIILLEVLKTNRAVLVFFASWCPVCVSEVPEANQFYIDNKDKNITVIGIDVGESRAKAGAFKEKMGISYPIALDFRGETAANYGVMGIPTIVVVNMDGRIVYKGHSIKMMADKIVP